MTLPLLWLTASLASATAVPPVIDRASIEAMAAAVAGDLADDPALAAPLARDAEQARLARRTIEAVFRRALRRVADSSPDALGEGQLGGYMPVAADPDKPSPSSARWWIGFNYQVRRIADAAGPGELARIDPCLLVQSVLLLAPARDDSIGQPQTRTRLHQLKVCPDGAASEAEGDDIDDFKELLRP